MTRTSNITRKKTEYRKRKADSFLAKQFATHVEVAVLKEIVKNLLEIQ